MAHQFSSIAFTPAVKDVQDQMGSRTAGQMLTERGPENATLGPDEKLYISLRDGFYMASITETGWPYVQFRGGEPGFMQVLDGHTIAFADVTGNRQYISTGNLKANPRVSLFFMDYVSQSRLKLLGEAEIIPWSSAGELHGRLPLPPSGRPERVIRIQVRAFDWNCPQHIPQRWTAEELKHSAVGARLRQLEAENRDLRARLSTKLNA